MSRLVRLGAAGLAAGVLGARSCADAVAITPPRVVVALDGVAALSQQPSKEFLLSQPAGAYTTARTCSGARRIFDWTTHIERTAASAAAMIRDAQSPTSPPPEMQPALLEQLGQPEQLRPRLEATVSAAVHKYCQAFGEEDELKLTILVSWASTAARAGRELGTIACHVQPLPPLPTPPIRVEVRFAPRSNARVKDSTWVAARAPLEALKRPDFNELLLADENDALLEGSQTNFFAIQDGVLYTAGEGVLAGTVRRLVLEVCEREGIPVELSPPNIKMAHKWEAALISSTSRLLLPIDEIYTPKEDKPSEQSDLLRRFNRNTSALATRLCELVKCEIEAQSFLIRA
ncbi:hypothetical protein AB1Y20_022247 [Prymnesium parvum]|uniref:Uncharacterized protein n=1 Tax=Prymnesium parvum TaxID=97485 RepID=A0AB34JI99_PRYPA